MLTDHELNTLAIHLTPRLLRALFETRHFSTSEFYDFNQVTALKFMSRYKEGIVPFLSSHADAEPVWAILNAKIAPDNRYKPKDLFIRHERIKDMQAFCVLQADPQGMAMLNSLPASIQPSIQSIFNASELCDNQDRYYPLYQDIIKVMAALTPQHTAGDTPLMFMAMKGYTRLAKSLLVAGANTSINDKGCCRVPPSVTARFEILSACEGYTALELAIKYKHFDMQATLIDYGSDINMKHSVFHPVHTAIAQGNKATVDLLIAKNADLSVTNMVQETPLLFSSRIKDKTPEGQAIHDALSGKPSTPAPEKHSYVLSPVATGVLLAVTLGIVLTLPPAMWVFMVIACLPATALAVNQIRMRM